MSLAGSLKMHLRVVAIHGAELRVVSLRPQTRTRFSTNFFHAAWHVLSDPGGGRLFGRLLWGLAFQRKPGTLVLIDRGHLVPTPSEADPPDPIALIPDELTTLDDDTLRALRVHLRRAPAPPTTIRWHTFGIPTDRDAARALGDDRFDPPGGPRACRERITRRAGIVCYTATRETLREAGAWIATSREGDDYHTLARERPRGDALWDGEVQTFRDFRDRVSTAIVARREVLGGDVRRLTTDDERRAIWDRAAQLRPPP